MVGLQNLRALDATLKKDTDSHLSDSLGARLLIPLNLVDTDIVLSVTC